MFEAALASCLSRPGLLFLQGIVMRMAAKVLQCLVAQTVAAFALFGKLASAATVLSIGDGDTISVLERGQKLTVRLN